MGRFLLAGAAHVYTATDSLTHGNPLSGALTLLSARQPAVPYVGSLAQAPISGFACEASEPRVHTNSERPSQAMSRASPTRRASFTSLASPTPNASSDAHRQHEPPSPTCFTNNSRETMRGRAPGMVRGPGPVPAARDSRAATAARAATAPVAGSAGIADSGRSVPTARDQPQPPHRQEGLRSPGQTHAYGISLPSSSKA